MKVTFYNNFTKRINSTKRPTGGVEKEVVLKERTSLHNPTFKLEDDGTGYDYCNCGIWYYYIVDKVYYPNNVIEYVCELDVLATNKACIGGMTSYIERCSQSSPNLMITDGYNYPSNKILTAETDVFDTGSDNERYILIITGADGVCAYNMNLVQTKALFKSISEHDFDDTEANKVMEYVVGFKRVPYTSTGSTSNIVLGNYDTGVSATKISIADGKLVASKEVTLSFPSSDYCNTPNYTDFSPYTSGLLYLPYVGVVNLDVDVLASTRTLGVHMYRNDMTGDIIYKITDGEKMISSYTGNCSQNVPLTANVNDAWGVKQANLEAIGGALTTITAIGGLTVATLASGGVALPSVIAGGSTAFSGLLTIAQSMTNHAQSVQVHAQTNGSISSNLSYWLGSIVKAIIFTKEPIYTNLTEINASYGMPYEKVGNISAISGGSYIKTKSCNLSGCAFDTCEKTRLMVDGGIYYE